MLVLGLFFVVLFFIFFSNSLNKCLTSKDLQMHYMKFFLQLCSNLSGSGKGGEPSKAENAHCLTLYLCRGSRFNHYMRSLCTHSATFPSVIREPLLYIHTSNLAMWGLPWIALGLEALLSTNQYFFFKKQRE